MIVRPYDEKDYNDCREICRLTAPKLVSGKKLDALWNMYVDYYIENAKDTCFVVADENDEAVGYVICAPDNNIYEKTYREKGYLKKLRKLSFTKYIVRLFELRYGRKFAADYPAHLHIDILPKAQRMGFGHKLIDSLLKRLKELNVKGVFLIVGASNKKGVSFYKKYGFKTVKNLKGAIVFGIRLP